jgi:hypothetical protein
MKTLHAVLSIAPLLLSLAAAGCGGPDEVDAGDEEPPSGIANEATAPLAANPTYLAFGATQLNTCTAAKATYFYATGATSVTIRSLSVAGSFVIASAPATPFVVRPNTLVTVSVKYCNAAGANGATGSLKATYSTGANTLGSTSVALSAGTTGGQ